LMLSLVVMIVLFQASCTDDNTLKAAGKITSIIHIAGAVGIAAAVILWLFKDKIRDFIRGKKNIKFLMAAVSVGLLFEGKIFAQDINFAPAVDTLFHILALFANITAGACGFYGLTRVAWLLVNEERSSGTALIMSIIGFVVATIAVGLLNR